MILILLSWIYIYFTTTLFGIAFSKFFRINPLNSIVTVIFGLFSVTLLASVWAFFGPINSTFHLVLLTFCLLFWRKNKHDFSTLWNSTWCEIKQSNHAVKIIMILGNILILAQSATIPFIIDNESYYIQTIKWLNEYGFVKGLANLHLFLGQTSGWHITQSVYSLSFLYDSFNDLNGFCLLIGNFFAFQKLNLYFNKGDKGDLVFGLFPLTYLFLFQFINAPSPDLAIYVFGFILFSYYLQYETTKHNFIFISILAFYCVFIKVTALVLLLFPLLMILKNFALLKRQLIGVGLLGVFVFILFVSKNIILSGYPLFPLLSFRIDSLDYTVPAIIMDFFFDKSMLHSFYISHSDYNELSVLNMMNLYFFNNGLCGFVGIFSVFILLFIPIFIIKMKIKKRIWSIYVAFILLLILLSYSSPQYRFYIYFTLFFTLFILSLWLTKPKWILRTIAFNYIILLILLWVPLSYSNLTNNKLLGHNTTLNVQNILIPEPNSNWKNEYKKTSIGNMHYHSPKDTSFFWVTGNGDLPCINFTQLDYFHNGFFYIPQQRSIDLSDGFYSQKVSGHE